MSTVHRTIIKVRSVITGLDESILPGFVDGENRIVGYYDDVQKSSPAAAVADLLSGQKREIEAKIAEMQRLQRI